MTSRIIFGMTGIARSGKDTAADFLVRDYGFARIALGDALKKNLYLLNPPIPMGASYTMLAELVDEVGWDQAKKHPMVRSLLQRQGTEAGWQFHREDLWTSWVDRWIAEREPDQDIVITDIRMPHESRWLGSIGGSLVLVTREAALEQLTPAQRSHISEQGAGLPDHEIANNGSLEDLHRAIQHVYREEIAYRQGR